MPRILLIGKTGQVGHYLLESLAPLGEVVAPDRSELDLTRSDSITTVIRAARPDAIVNAAGSTLVDPIESDPGTAMQVNGVAAGIVADEARRCGAHLVHYSTVFVFDGSKRTPYVEEDAPNPVNAYGRSKLAGDEAITAVGGSYLILRASWTYSDRRSNFPKALLKPTWARAYADTTAELLKHSDRIRSRPGIYHLSSAGQTTRYEWGGKMLALAREHTGQRSGWASLRPIKSSEYPHVAARPLYTLMDNSKFHAAFGIRMSDWEDQLRTFMREWAARGGIPTG